MSDRQIFPESTRKKIESALEKLIDLLDQMDADPDSEEENEHGDGSLTGIGIDDEPSLGSTNAMNQERAWKVGGTDLEYDGDTVADPDLEDTADDEPWLGTAPWPPGKYALDTEHDDSETEVSLGSTHSINQEHAWAGSRNWFGNHDEEFEGDTCPSSDCEPSLGSPIGDGNQTRWAQGKGSCEEEPTLGSSVIGNHEHWGAAASIPRSMNVSLKPIKTTRTKMK